MTISINRGYQILEQILGKLVVEDGERISLESPVWQLITMDDSVIFEDFSRVELNEWLERSNLAKSDDDLLYSWGNSCEVLVIENGLRNVLHRNVQRGGLSASSDDESGLKFSLSPPSVAYFMLLTDVVLADDGSSTRHPYIRDLRSARRRFDYDLKVYERRQAGRTASEPRKIRLEELIQRSIHWTTLKISAGKSRSDFRALANAFLFNLAYNHDVSYLVASGIDSLGRSGRISRVRRSSVESVDAPRMIFEEDLVHHYQLGVSAESPSLAYLSFYHVVEHFYEKVYSEDLVKTVRRKIADPSFSLRRMKDVQQVIDVVSRAQRKVREEGGVDEQRSLQLVLERYVDVQRLASDLEDYSPGLSAHYATNGVAFSEAPIVNLAASAIDAVYAKLAQRIYKTRNSLVHAKEGSKPKYRPFENDRELVAEVPLMRFCAEQVIIATGQVF